MVNVFSTINNLRRNIFGGGQSNNVFNYGGGTNLARESAIELAQSSPVAILNKDPLGFSSLSYPRDLINDGTNGHYMLFYVNVQNKTKFPYTRAKDGVDFGGTITKQVYEERYQAIAGTPHWKTVNVPVGRETHEGGGAIQYAPNSKEIEEAFKKQQTINESDVKTLRKNKTKKKTGLAATGAMQNNTVRITDSVAIYLPPNVQDNYTTKYNATETGIIGFLAASGGKAIEQYRSEDFRGFVQTLIQTAGGPLEEILKNVGSSIVESMVQAEGGYELANKIFGRSTNPYMEVLFGGPELRTFTYNFTFAPRNEQEQLEVKKIIELFRFHQAPELRNEHSMFMGLPSEFDIHYMYQPPGGGIARENSFYNKIATCVLQSVNVDYTPGSVTSHADGSPVQIKMALNFLETEMITKDHVKAGY